MSFPGGHWPFGIPDAALPVFEAFEQALPLIVDKERFQAALWGITRKHIAGIPRYRGLGVDARLEDFPILTSAEIGDLLRTDALVHPDYPADVLLTSGGTTGSIPKVVAHSYIQWRAVVALAEAQCVHTGRHDDGSAFTGEPFARLRLIVTSHGPRFPHPRGPLIETMLLPWDQPKHVSLAAAILGGQVPNPQTRRPLQEIHAPRQELGLLFNRLTAAGFSFRASPVKRFYWGGPHSPWLTETVASLAGVRIVEGYGSTEAWRANCYRCIHCGLFHSPWSAIHEYLPWSEGDRLYEVVVTNLAPFTLKTLLVRYRTGDIVRLGPHCSFGQGRGFEVLGRRTHLMAVRNDSGLISDVIVKRAMIGLGGPHRSTDLRFLGERLAGSERSAVEFGCAVFCLSTGSDGQVELLVEVPPDATAAARGVLRDEIGARLRLIEPSLTAEVPIYFVPQGALEGVPILGDRVRESLDYRRTAVGLLPEFAGPC